MFSREKKLKKKLKSRSKMFAGWLSFSHPSIAEIFANINFDFIAIDMEHSTINNYEAQRIISTVQAYQVPCIPRPLSHKNDIIKPLLESGCDGMLFPNIDKNSHMEDAIHNFKYSPIGGRNFGINRAQSYGFNSKDYFSYWNQISSILIQIESKNGVENLEEILKKNHKNIDGVMIGPYDLSGSLNCPGDFSNVDYLRSIKHVIKLCKSYRISCGTQLSDISSSLISENFKYGFNFLVLGSDLFALWNWAENIEKLIKKSL